MNTESLKECGKMTYTCMKILNIIMHASVILIFIPQMISNSSFTALTITTLLCSIFFVIFIISEWRSIFKGFRRFLIDNDLVSSIVRRGGDHYLQIPYIHSDFKRYVVVLPVENLMGTKPRKLLEPHIYKFSGPTGDLFHGIKTTPTMLGFESVVFNTDKDEVFIDDEEIILPVKREYQNESPVPENIITPEDLTEKSSLSDMMDELLQERSVSTFLDVAKNVDSVVCL